MNKQKLIEWIRLNERKVDGAIHAFKLLDAIQNGTFDTEPCDTNKEEPK